MRCGGAGKSTAATELASKLEGSQIVHIDDFYKPKEQRMEITDQTPVHINFEFERLKQEVLEPLGRLTVAKPYFCRGTAQSSTEWYCCC